MTIHESMQALRTEISHADNKFDRLTNPERVAEAFHRYADYVSSLLPPNPNTTPEAPLAWRLLQLATICVRALRDLDFPPVAEDDRP